MIEAARAAAVNEARLFACDSVRRGHLALDHRAEVVDEAGGVILGEVGDAFTLEGGR